MWRQRHVCRFAWLFCLLATCHSITVTDRASTEPTSSAQRARNTTASVYRVSAPKTRQPSNRVPAHLQGVRSAGYAYDDADDVIHIIEPPQHFQQLKRLMQQPGGAAVWTQQRKVRITQPSIAMKMPMKAKQPFQQLTGTKVDRPAVPQRQQQQRLKPAGGAAGDLLPQETQTQLQQQHLQQVHVPPPPLPLEILASVRKTERLLQQRQQQPGSKQQPQRAFPKQRLKTKQTHTVIMEKAYEQEKFARGKEQRLSGQKWRKTRARRDVKSDSAGGVGGSAAAEELRGAQLDIEKGTKLVLRLKALLKNADAYLPADEYAANDSNTRIAENVEAAAELQKILDNSFNVTSVIMQHVERTRNATGAKRRPPYGERLEEQPSPTSFASAATVKRVKKQGAVGREQRAATPTTQDSDELADSAQPQPQPDRVVAATLLYDDVMANIRSMLQARNAQLLAEQQAAGNNGNVNVNAVGAALYPDSSAPVAVEQLGELQQLQQYLQELQQLVTQLPALGAGPYNADLTLNTREFIQGGGSGGRNRTAADWYLINGEGKIFETSLHENFKPSTNIFHRFPDIPVAGKQQLNNGTLLPLDIL